MIDENLVAITFLLSFSYAVVTITRIVVDARTRRQMIQSGATPQQVEAVFAQPLRDPAVYGALKWGMVTAAVGCALILIQFLPYEASDPILLGVILLFGACGLLSYYATARRLA